MRMYSTVVWLPVITSLMTGLRSARAEPIFRIDAAPVFANDSSGSGRQMGPYATIYSATIPIRSSLTSVNTGPLANWNLSPPLNRGYDYWLKSQWGPYNEFFNQMVLQLEGTVIGGQGGMIDIMNNANKYEQSVPIPPGKLWWRRSFKISILNVPTPTDPVIKTNSRVQHTILHDHDPATENDTGFSNVLTDDGTNPVIRSSYDAAGLDAWFEFDGSAYWGDALEDTSLRLVIFMEGTVSRPADFDNDGDVDGDDFLTWQASFGVDDGGDADGDGDTDGDDFLIWQSQFGSGSGSVSAAVPEPAGVVLLTVALVGAVCLSRRQ